MKDPTKLELKLAYDLFLTRRDDWSDEYVGVYPTHDYATKSAIFFLGSWPGAYVRGIVRKVYVAKI